MTDELIKQMADKYANKLYEDGRCTESTAPTIQEIYIAGAHSRDREVMDLEHLLKAERTTNKVLAEANEELRNPWISVKERLPEKEIDNISIPVAAITNEGYWFKGQYDYDNKEWFFSEDPDHLEFEIGEFVTYWMHIPKLKKGK